MILKIKLEIIRNKIRDKVRSGKMARWHQEALALMSCRWTKVKRSDKGRL